MKKNPHNPNHDKNMKVLFNEDESVRKRQWFFTAFPSLKEEDFQRYIASERCAICITKFDNDRTMHKGDAICGRCNEIINSLIDMEHLIQLRDYLKGKEG
jgi:hypothetical protein